MNTGNLKLDGISLDKENKKLVVKCSTETFVTRKEIDLFALTVKAALIQNGNAFLENFSIETDITVLSTEKPEERMQKYQSAFFEEIAILCPAAKGFLEDAVLEVKDEFVYVTLKKRGAFLLNNLCKEIMEEQAEMLFGRKWRFDISDEACDELEIENHNAELNRIYCEMQSKRTMQKGDQEVVINENLLVGKEIFDLSVPMRNVRADLGRTTCEGHVLSIDERVINNEKYLVLMDVTDNTFSFTVKLFVKKNQFKQIKELVKKGTFVRFRGDLIYDTFSKEQVFMAKDLVIAEKIQKTDVATEKRVELHLHTKMSAMDAVTDIENYVVRAAAWGHKAMAITDHGVVQAYPVAYETVKKINKNREEPFKVIYGIEAYLIDENPVENKKRDFHIIILCTTDAGVKNLYKLVSEAHMNYFYKRPRMTRALIAQHRDGLILGSACEAGELFTAFVEGASAEQIDEIAQFYDYLEIQPTGNNAFMIRDGTFENEAAIEAVNQKIVALGDKLEKPVVATCDVHFLDPNDALYRSVLQFSMGFEDAQLQAPLFFRTTNEMLKEFQYLGKEKAFEVVVTNTNRVADLCELVKPIPDGLFSPKIEGAEDDIRRLSEEKAKELYGEPLPEIIFRRMERELDSIITHHFSVMYMIAQKLVLKSLEDGYLVGSRGSVGSSFVAFLSGITEVNSAPPHYRCTCKYSEFISGDHIECGLDLPEKECPNCGKMLIRDGFDIQFETFLGFNGDKEPDIDLNFSGEYQSIAHKYTEELFGADKVFRAGTISGLADKTAAAFARKYIEELGLPANSAEVKRLALGCEGIKKTTSQHPGGIMIIPQENEVYDFTPIQRPADARDSDKITTHFDYNFLHGSILKLDILAHADPTAIRMLQTLTGVDPLGIELGEKRTMTLFSSTDALGVSPKDIDSDVGTFAVPEFGTSFVRNMLVDTRPKYFSELIRISGLSHGTNVWLGNAKENIEKRVCNLKEAICCRDDILTFLTQCGVPPKHAFDIMEQVRKGKGLKEEDEAAMRTHRIPEWYIESCNKISYMFPRAHATAYVIMAFRIAWYKVYYPIEFYATYFTVRADEFDASLMCHGKETAKKALVEIRAKGKLMTAREKNVETILEVVIEMNARGFSFLPVDFYQSAAKEFLIEEGKLRPPLNALPGLGMVASENIVKKRTNQVFLSQDELKNKMGISKSLIEILMQHGCIEDLPESSQMTLFM